MLEWTPYDDISGFNIELQYRKYERTGRDKRYRFVDLGATVIDLEQGVEMHAEDLEEGMMRNIKRANPEREEEFLKRRCFFNKRFNTEENFIEGDYSATSGASYDGYNKYGWLGRTYARENGFPSWNQIMFGIIEFLRRHYNSLPLERKMPNHAIRAPLLALFMMFKSIPEMDRGRSAPDLPGPPRPADSSPYTQMQMHLQKSDKPFLSANMYGNNINDFELYNPFTEPEKPVNIKVL